MEGDHFTGSSTKVKRLVTKGVEILLLRYTLNFLFLKLRFLIYSFYVIVLDFGTTKFLIYYIICLHYVFDRVSIQQLITINNINRFF